MKSKTCTGVTAMAQDCCQLFWHSSTDQQGMHFALNPAALNLRFGDWILV